MMCSSRPARKGSCRAVSLSQTTARWTLGEIRGEGGRGGDRGGVSGGG